MEREEPIIKSQNEIKDVKNEVAKLTYIGSMPQIEVETIKGYKRIKTGDSFECSLSTAKRLMALNKSNRAIFKEG